MLNDDKFNYENMQYGFVLDEEDEIDLQFQADKLELLYNGKKTEWEFVTSGWRKWVIVDNNGRATLFNHNPFYHGSDRSKPLYLASEFLSKIDDGFSIEDALIGLPTVVTKYNTARKLTQSDLDSIEAAKLKRLRRAEKRLKYSNDNVRDNDCA